MRLWGELGQVWAGRAVSERLAWCLSRAADPQCRRAGTSVHVCDLTLPGPRPGVGDLTPLGSSGVTTRASHELPGVDVILPFVRSDPVLRKRSDVGELTPLRSSGHPRAPRSFPGWILRPC